MILNLLLMTGSVAAMAPHPKLMKQAVKAPPYFSASDFQAAADADPCAMISKAFEAAPRQKNATGPIILDLPPSVGTACLKSVPVAPGPDVDLLDYLGPYIEYQSTLELLQDPPEEYLLPGVDIIGGMKAMKQKLKSNGYETQYDFMMDLQSLFVAANDNHFGYTPGLLSAFRQAREAFDFVSISKDGLEMPQVYASQDIFTAGNLSYTPSPIDTIDGQDVFEFLENDALRNPQGAQDPDARLNSVFRSVPAAAAGIPSGAQTTVFEIPDNYTIVHKNGTSRMVKTSIITLPTIDLCEIRSGEDFQQRFEVPPRKQPTPSQPPEKKRPQSSPPPEPTLPGYPVPLVKHSNSNVASYALNDTELSNTTVISFLSFVALNVEDPLSQDFDLNSFVREFGDVMDRTAKAAKDQGRGKLIIDMSANGGGSLDLADFAYTAFFPGAPFDAFDRYRLNGGLELTGKFLSFNESLQVLVGPAGLPFGADNQTIDDPNAFFEAPPVKNQKLTAAFHRDTSVPYLDRPDVFLRGYESEQKMGDKKREAPWSPEDIVILTDGQCASACTIFTGLMVRNFGIRTIALGGRPLNKPMQAIGGVRGSQLSTNAENKGLITDFVQAASRNRDGQDVLSQVERPIPKIQDPPVLPFMEDPANGGSVNSRNAYSGDDVDGFPLHFKYEAANCRLFYTQKMVLDPAESWRQAAKIAWGNGTCVSGSTVNKDGRIGSEVLPFDSSVRGTAVGIPRPTLESGAAKPSRTATASRTATLSPSPSCKCQNQGPESRNNTTKDKCGSPK